MSRDRSVYVCECTRCGTENHSEDREFRCVQCDVAIRLMWMAEYAPKKGPTVARAT